MPSEITRAETGERARLLKVDSYEAGLDLTKGAEVFGSTSMIRFSCSQPGASTYVDLIAEVVHEITLNRTAIDPAGAYADGRVVLPALADRQ
jgi:aminopeptidase N